MSLKQQAIEILKRNDRGGYTVPTHGLYPFQWNWDSAFVALGFAEFDRDRAWQELETLISGQWQNGMIPHIIFHQEDEGYFPGPAVWQTGESPATSAITQPPVMASILLKLWQDEGADPNNKRMLALYQAALRSHRWFHKYRDPLENGLVMAVHNWETGRDNSSEWDEALARVDISQIQSYLRRDTGHVDADMRPTSDEYDRYVAILEFGRNCGWDPQEIADNGPFRMIDVGMSMMLLRANHDLLILAQAIGDSSVIIELEERIALSEIGIEWLWNDDVSSYCSRDVVSGKSSGLVTSASFLAFYAKAGHAHHQQLLKTLESVAGSCKFLLPSLKWGSRSYDHKRYWRGPIWLVVNYMVSIGLLEHDQINWAHRINKDTLSLIEKSGFYESFSPETGAGTGGTDFSWTAAIYLITQVIDGANNE